MPKKTYKYHETPDFQPLQAAGNVQPIPGNDLPSGIQTEEVKEKPKAKKPFLVPIIAGSFFSLIIVVFVLALIFKNYQRNQNNSDNPNNISNPDEASASASLYQDLIDKVDALENDLNTTDIINLDLTYPHVDWKLKIDK
jgi:hypothetical protein